MSVLIEAISIVIRHETVEQHFPGGVQGLKDCPPNKTFCDDGSLVRVGFMTPFDALNYARRLERMGFEHLVDGAAKDFVGINQHRGLLDPCDWLTVIYFDIDDDREKRVTAAHLVGEDPDPMAAPDGWTRKNH
jgi:hypothetical protein